jgi:hypothetical protein
MPAATAQQVRNAIILSADKNVLGDGSGPLDQGAGFVSGSAALDLLRNWLAPDTPGEAGKSSRFVTLNIHQGAQVPVYIGTVTRTVSNLRPGQRFETYYRVTHETSAVTITLSDVVPGAVQNPLFGDDILLTVHSAKTSAIGASGDYEVFAFTQGGTFVIPNPEQGLMRITVNGDWTNASPISAKVAIKADWDINLATTRLGRLRDGETVTVPFKVKAGVLKLDSILQWDNGWVAYPTNDIDYYLVDPNGTIHAGATLDAPERIVIDNPVAGNWSVILDGFTVHESWGDWYRLRILADGKIVR